MWRACLAAAVALAVALVVAACSTNVDLGQRPGPDGAADALDAS